MMAPTTAPDRERAGCDAPGPWEAVAGQLGDGPLIGSPGVRVAL